jgi:hypothetical protein
MRPLRTENEKFVGEQLLVCIATPQVAGTPGASVKTPGVHDLVTTAL